MKKFSLPVQLFKILVSLIISWIIVVLVFSSIFIDGIPDNLNFLEWVLAILFAIIVVIIYDYNEVCRAKSSVQKARQDVRASIEVRKKLIDKAERVVDKYVDKETDVYSKFAETRKSEESVLSSFKVVTESYPDLKSNAAVQKLLSQLEDVEKLIFQAKKQYTTFVAEHNTIIHTFPVVLIKPLCKWKDEEVEVIFEEELVTDQELGI